MVLFIISFENLGSQYCLCIILLSGCCVYLPLPCVYYSSLAFSVCAYKRNLPSCWCAKSSLTSSDLFPSVEVASSGAIVAVISKSPQSSVVVSCVSLSRQNSVQLTQQSLSFLLSLKWQPGTSPRHQRGRGGGWAANLGPSKIFSLKQIIIDFNILFFFICTYFQ